MTHISELAKTSIAAGVGAVAGAIVADRLNLDNKLLSMFIGSASGMAIRTLSVKAMEKAQVKPEFLSQLRMARLVTNELKRSLISSNGQVKSARTEHFAKVASNLGNFERRALNREFSIFQADCSTGVELSIADLLEYVTSKCENGKRRIRVCYPTIAPSIHLTMKHLSDRLAKYRITLEADCSSAASQEMNKTDVDFAFMASDTFFYAGKTPLRFLMPIYESPCSVLRDVRGKPNRSEMLAYGDSASMSHLNVSRNHLAKLKNHKPVIVGTVDKLLELGGQTNPGDIVFGWESIADRLRKANPSLRPEFGIEKYPRTVSFFAHSDWCKDRLLETRALNAFIALFSYEWNGLRKRAMQFFGLRGRCTRINHPTICSYYLNN